MPVLKIVTNISKSAIPKNFTQTILPVLSKCVLKPENKFMVTITADSFLTMGGNEQPGVIASLESIGNLNPQQNQIIARDITECISKELGVEKNRVYITYYDLLPSFAALNGATREGLV